MRARRPGEIWRELKGVGGVGWGGETSGRPGRVCFGLTTCARISNGEISGCGFKRKPLSGTCYQLLLLVK